jgi:hypothetical protein
MQNAAPRYARIRRAVPVLSLLESLPAELIDLLARTWLGVRDVGRLACTSRTLCTRTHAVLDRALLDVQSARWRWTLHSKGERLVAAVRKRLASGAYCVRCGKRISYPTRLRASVRGWVVLAMERPPRGAERKSLCACCATLLPCACGAPCLCGDWYVEHRTPMHPWAQRVRALGRGAQWWPLGTDEQRGADWDRYMRWIRGRTTAASDSGETSDDDFVVSNDDIEHDTTDSSSSSSSNEDPRNDPDDEHECIQSSRRCSKRLRRTQD